MNTLVLEHHPFLSEEDINDQEMLDLIIGDFEDNREYFNSLVYDINNSFSIAIDFLNEMKKR